MSGRLDSPADGPSDSGPTIDRIRALEARRRRDESGLFYIEGVRFVKQAVDSGATVEELVVARRLLRSPFGQKLARRLRRQGVPCTVVRHAEFVALSASREPQGLGAIVRQRWTPLRDARPRDGLCWIALHRVRSPGNLGTILRTCDAVGAAGLIVLGRGVDPHHPGVVRGSMGAVFHQRLVRTSHASLARWAERHRCAIVGASPHADVEFRQVDYRRPTVLIVGEERRGLSGSEEALCDLLVKIPMVGHSDSLNLGVAASLMLYEVFRYRRR
ncbi:MAG: TrmH family RNA methyltransferase [Planctomycetota bacterium]